MLVLVRLSMRVPARRIRATLGLEGLVRFGDDQMHLAQHVGQHMVGFQLQVVRRQFQLHMAIAQVVGGAQ